MSKNNSKKFDTFLTITICDLKWEPISQAKLLLEYDGQCHLVITDASGSVKDIQIEDALKGIQISLYTIKNKFEVIAHHKILPLGKKF